MHTTPETPNPDLLALRDQLKLERLRYRFTMLRVQTRALETLERLMDDPEPTGNEKADRFEATERNRQRLAANQTLIHCRTAEREKRLAKSNRQAAKDPKGLEPNRASDGWQASMKNILTESFSPRARTWQPTEGRMTDEGAVDASHASPSGCAADPSPQSSNNSGATACPAGQAVRSARGAVAKSESSTEGAGHAVNGSACTTSHGLRPTDRRTQTMPPKKFLKPKHPRRSRKRRNKR